MDGHHPHGVLVRFRNRGLSNPGVLSDLVVHPLQEGAQSASAGPIEASGLFDEEPVAAPLLAHSRVVNRRLHQPAFANEPVDQGARGFDQASPMEGPQHIEGAERHVAASPR